VFSGAVAKPPENRERRLITVRIFVYPGSFDPVTNGHLDIIDRASKICDKLIVAVLINRSKKPVFSMEERVAFLDEILEGRPNIVVIPFSGLLVDFMKKQKATTVIKGLRAVSDFEYEFQMALLNKNLNPEIETLFMMTNINYSYLSSSAVRELAAYGGNIRDLVPDIIVDRIYAKFRSNE
jgi:pantetheine-phosphate adenylyltransferase